MSNGSNALQKVQIMNIYTSTHTHTKAKKNKTRIVQCSCHNHLQDFFFFCYIPIVSQQWVLVWCKTAQGKRWSG